MFIKMATIPTNLKMLTSYKNDALKNYSLWLRRAWVNNNFIKLQTIKLEKDAILMEIQIVLRLSFKFNRVQWTLMASKTLWILWVLRQRAVFRFEYNVNEMLSLLLECW